MEPRTIESGDPRWNALQRLGLRFLFVYFLLFVLTGEEIRQIPFLAPLADRYTALWHAVAAWIGRHLLDIHYPIVLDRDGSGDTTFRWILLLCYPVLAAFMAVIWSALDRKRAEPVNAWLRFLLRFTLATEWSRHG